MHELKNEQVSATMISDFTTEWFLRGSPAIFFPLELDLKFSFRSFRS